MKKPKERWELRVAEHFVLEREQWSRLVELIDRSPQENRGLEKLFAKRSVFRAETG